MTHMRLRAAAAIIAAVVLLGFLLSAPHVREVPIDTPAEVPEATPAVTLRDSFKKGTHTITGSLEAPDACHTLSASATFENTASSAETIQVAITLTESQGVCLELPTTLTFTTTVVAPAEAPLTATVNGAPATTTP